MLQSSNANYYKTGQKSFFLTKISRKSIDFTSNRFHASQGQNQDCMAEFIFGFWLQQLPLTAKKKLIACVECRQSAFFPVCVC